MKKAKGTSKLHIPFIVMMFAALACIVTALCLFDYDFSVTFGEMLQANTPSFILAVVFVALNVALIIASVCLRVKKDEYTYGQVALAFQITTVLILELTLCVPIFIIWIIEKIHDAASSRKQEKV